MTLPLTELQRITVFAGWGASGRLLACGKGSTDIVELRRIRSRIRAGCHGLSIPWTSLRNIADFSGTRATANLCETEMGYDMMKLLRRDTYETITRNHWMGIALRMTEVDQLSQQRRAERQSWIRQPNQRPRFPQLPRVHYDPDDENVAMWRRWAGDD